MIKIKVHNIVINITKIIDKSQTLMEEGTVINKIIQMSQKTHLNFKIDIVIDDL